MGKIEKEICDYFKQSKGFEKYIEDDKFIYKSDECFKNALERIFGCKISCNLYDQVVNGEGDEVKKIKTIYSSSLQSLLFFSQVREDNPLYIMINDKNIPFTKVCFEYKNKVIGFPSSVDVVLVDSDEKNILFIESKLLEIARDSKRKKEDKIPGSKEIGISYFSDNESGYNRCLGLSANDLSELGIIMPLTDEYPYTDIRGKSDKKGKVTTIENNTYVYSYGIKQVLAHIIGIKNLTLNKIDNRCLNDFFSLSTKANTYFMVIYNELPGINNPQIKIAQTDFVKHVEKIKTVLETTGTDNLPTILPCKTYQELFGNNREYLKSDKIINYYHLS